VSPEGVIPAVTLSPAVEAAISEALQQSENGVMLALDPAVAQKVINNLATELEAAAALNYQPLLMCSSQIRMQFKRLVERFIPNINIISYDEILNTVEVKSLGTVELSDAN
jgi:flagellar biosynthesis protein FlhA